MQTNAMGLLKTAKQLEYTVSRAFYTPSVLECTPLPLSPSPLLYFPLPSLPLEVAPSNPARGLGRILCILASKS